MRLIKKLCLWKSMSHGTLLLEGIYISLHKKWSFPLRISSVIILVTIKKTRGSGIPKLNKRVANYDFINRVNSNCDVIGNLYVTQKL